jgi:hypothetical protein
MISIVENTMFVKMICLVSLCGLATACGGAVPGPLTSDPDPVVPPAPTLDAGCGDADPAQCGSITHPLWDGAAPDASDASNALPDAASGDATDCWSLYSTCADQAAHCGSMPSQCYSDSGDVIHQCVVDLGDAGIYVVPMWCAVGDACSVMIDDAGVAYSGECG